MDGAPCGDLRQLRSGAGVGFVPLSDVAGLGRRNVKSSLYGTDDKPVDPGMGVAVSFGGVGLTGRSVPTANIGRP